MQATSLSDHNRERTASQSSRTISSLSFDDIGNVARHASNLVPQSEPGEVICQIAIRRVYGLTAHYDDHHETNDRDQLFKHSRAKPILNLGASYGII
jgi:hypothetical protein